MKSNCVRIARPYNTTSLCCSLDLSGVISIRRLHRRRAALQGGGLHRSRHPA